MDKNRVNCDNPLDNARTIKVEEISAMSMIPIRSIVLPEYPTEMFYAASDVLLILGELVACNQNDKKYQKEMKAVIERETQKLFKVREVEL